MLLTGRYISIQACFLLLYQLYAKEAPAMSQIHEYFLAETLPFINLLLLKDKLSRLKPGDQLDVTIENEETAHDLEKIVTRSKDRIIGKKTTGNSITISVEIGNLSHEEEKR
jgi:TusA-related sulfurtransferase